VRWADAVVLAARGLVRRAGRATLTVLAVALAAALLTALLVIAATAKSRVIGQLTKGGPLATIRVEGAALGSADVHRLERLPDVRTVLPVAVSQELVVPPDPPTFGAAPATPSGGITTGGLQPFTDGVVGIDMSHADQFPVSLLAGRLPHAGSTTEAAVTEDYLSRVGLDRDHPVPVLGTELQLGAPRFLGSDLASGVWGRWTRATIVGVVAQEAGSGDIIVPVRQALAAQSFEGLDPGTALPELGISSMADAALPTPTATDRGSAPSYAAFLIGARSLDRVGNALDEIGSLGYSTSAPQNLIATVQRYLHVVQIVLSAIGLIALVIAALGIANALLAAIRERRQEIGVLKAIGARDRDVRRIFLVEASLVGLVGGLIGASAGWAIARTVAAVVNAYLLGQGLLGVRLVAPGVILTATVGGSVVLALAAGAFPATRAARLPAREAMGDA
jgi:putative ABC transport system permease protein